MIDGARPLQPLGRIAGRNDVQQQRRLSHFVGREDGERHDGKKGCAAGLSDRCIEKRDARD